MERARQSGHNKKLNKKGTQSTMLNQLRYPTIKNEGLLLLKRRLIQSVTRHCLHQGCKALKEDRLRCNRYSKRP